MTRVTSNLGWLALIWILLAIARARIQFQTFSRIAPTLGLFNQSTQFIPLADAHQQARARHIHKIILATAKKTPWESNCFPQAIVASKLLRLFKIPHAIFFGVSRDSLQSQFKAHAWVQVDRIFVSGGNGFQEHIPVGSFICPLSQQIQSGGN